MSPAAPWLVVTPASSRTPGSLSVWANPTSLGAGNHTTSILVSSAGAGNSPISIPVTLSVRNPKPTLTAAPTALTFNYATDDASLPATQSLSVTTSGDPVSFTVAVSGGTWLNASPASGISLLGSPIVITVTARPTGLLPATYTGKITITPAMRPIRLSPYP